MNTKPFLIFLIGLICFSCNDESLENKYNYWISNNDFSGKNELIRKFENTINARQIDSLNYPKYWFLKNQFSWKINDNILINENSDKAVILLMSIGLDNKKDTLGSVNVLSAERLSNNWIINDGIDMTFYYFTHYYNENLTFDKINELSTKRMIKGGYMNSEKEFNHKYVDDNWNYLFGNK
ncbi:hypothetical protein N7U66_04855 [Lacinutrix neustonica]|uniref:Uncharacterized protein n=1 Tax=Lacinutrix neustonica TaxID=2980107 RepID=A0A9E8MWJ8_9FLAO|nr:hypothetical protein [Lacinutrix neustonica]WAC02962.1 hypothetical protein N7U66_04855 [Lacinutrix neustonica]